MTSSTQDQFTKATAKPDTQSPSATGRRILGKASSFWRAAVSAGLAAAAFGLLRWEEAAINQPGALPFLLMAIAIIIAGPTRNLEKQTSRQKVFIAIAVTALLMPFALLFLSPEAEAALLTFPIWSFILAALFLGWRLRQQDRDLALLMMVAIGLFRIGFNAGGPAFNSSELIWWLVTFLWLGAAFLFSRQQEKQAIQSISLLAGIGWFVLAISALTLQEWRYPYIHLTKYDRAAAVQMLEERPIAGWGLGSFPEVMLEFTQREPEHGPFSPPGYLRMLTELGVLPAMLIIIMLAALFVSSLVSRRWTKQRYMAVSIVGFWIVAMLSYRGSYYVPLCVVFFLFPLTLGRQELHIRADDNGEPELPPVAWEPWLLAILALMVPATLFPAARWQLKRELASRPLEAKSILPAWTEPYRERAWHIRERSPEIAQYADPRDKLRPVVERWVEVAPHDEMAWLEYIRLAYKSDDRTEGERVARQAYERLPWSPAIAAWTVRIMRERGRVKEAIDFLEQHMQQFGPLHPLLQRRLVELKMQTAQEKE